MLELVNNNNNIAIKNILGPVKKIIRDKIKSIRIGDRRSLNRKEVVNVRLANSFLIILAWKTLSEEIFG